MLEHLQAHLPNSPIRSWRTKTGREVDFVLVRARGEVDAVECEWDPAAFDPVALAAFRARYPRGKNYLLTPQEGPAHVRRYGGLEVMVCNPDGIAGSPT